MKDFYSKDSYRLEQSILTKLGWQKGTYECLRKEVSRICARKECGKMFIVRSSSPKKYCSQSCAAKINNTGRVQSIETRTKIAGGVLRENRFCLNCSLPLKKQDKYCSLKCQYEYQYLNYLELWKNGLVSGTKGVTTKFVSGYIRRYLFEKFDNRCSKCGWNEKHPITGSIPLEMEHMDGNAENNKEENLTLLCPNCHSLTKFYKNLNRGKGRKWRMEKYVKNTPNA
jgi:hypothetical protein